ncbi:MAG: hypothetical protein QW358_03865 [Candidatus Hadarchaeum sp.]
MGKEDTKKKILDDCLIFGSGQYGANIFAPTDAERDALRDGIDLLQEAVDRLKNVSPEFKHGNLFEYIEAAKFNSCAAAKGSPLRAHVTAAEGVPHAPADIVITNGYEVVKQIQTKSSNNPETLVQSLSDPKYHGMDKLVPEDQVDSVRLLADNYAHPDHSHDDGFCDTSHHVTGELHAGNIGSGGTSYYELRFAAENPDQYIEKQGVTSLPEEAFDISMHAAEAGFIIGGAVEVIKNSIAALQGNINLEQAAKNSLIGAGKSSVRSALTGSFGSILRNAGHAIGLDTLAKSNIATGLAAGLINTGRIVLLLSRGEITAEQAMEQIGQTGISTISGIYAGVVGALFFPSFGAVIGSLGGYLIAANIYQSCITIMKYARLAEKESLRNVAMAKEACRVMARQREEFEHRLENDLRFRRQEFGKCFLLVEQGIERNYPQVATLGLSALALLFGRKIMSFKELDDFLVHSSGPLVI